MKTSFATTISRIGISRLKMQLQPVTTHESAAYVGTGPGNEEITASIASQ